MQGCWGLVGMDIGTPLHVPSAKCKAVKASKPGTKDTSPKRQNKGAPGLCCLLKCLAALFQCSTCSLALRPCCQAWRVGKWSCFVRVHLFVEGAACFGSEGKPETENNQFGSPAKGTVSSLLSALCAFCGTLLPIQLIPGVARRRRLARLRLRRARRYAGRSWAASTGLIRQASD